MWEKCSRKMALDLIKELIFMDKIICFETRISLSMVERLSIEKYQNLPKSEDICDLGGPFRGIKFMRLWTA